MAGSPGESFEQGVEKVKTDRELLCELQERYEKDVAFLKSEAKRVDVAWQRTWQEFQQRYNERCAQVEVLERMLKKLVEDK